MSIQPFLLLAIYFIYKSHYTKVKSKNIFFNPKNLILKEVCQNTKAILGNKTSKGLPNNFIENPSFYQIFCKKYAILAI